MTEGWVAFERPAALLLLAALPLFAALYLLLFVARRRAIRAFAGVGGGLVSASPASQAARNALRLVGLAALIVAIAGPQLGHPVERRDVVVLLDVSASMGVQDVAPTRLTRARDVIDRLVADLGAPVALTTPLGGERGRVPSEHRVGLVYFGGDARVRFPFTPDTDVVGKALNYPGYPFVPATGASLEAGLRAAVDQFPQDVRGQGPPKSLVLITDGEGAENVSYGNALRSQDIRVFAVGIGTAAGGEVPRYGPEGQVLPRIPNTTPTVSRLESAGLEALAAATGGRYWTYTGSEPVPQEVAAEVLAMPPTEVIGESWVVDDRRRSILLAFALVVLMLEIWVPERRRMPAPSPTTGEGRGRRAAETPRVSSLPARGLGSGPVAAQPARPLLRRGWGGGP